MILKKHKYLRHLIVLIILASCSSTSKNIQFNSIEYEERDSKDYQEIFDYQSFSLNDLKTIQRIIENDDLNQQQLRDAKLLKKNFQKILSKKKFSLELNPGQQYSKEVIRLIYQFNLPIKVLWDKTEKNPLPENLLMKKINGFCSSVYEDAIASINEVIKQTNDSILIIYSKNYESFMKNLKSNNSNFMTEQYDASDFQAFAAEILGINFSNNRFKKISSLSPSQKLNYIPQPRSDLSKIILLLGSQEYKSMLPALRYHGGNSYEYINFISSMEEITNPLQLLDYEDSWTPISKYLATKIQKDELVSIEKFLELGALHEWLLVQILNQAEVESAKINGVNGSIIFKSNSCSKRIIPLKKISTNLFST